VEWLDVTGGFDTGPGWTYLHNEMIRSGYAWVGVSAQRAGIDGGTGPVGSSLALKSVDPSRYGSLVHPGDDYSYDVFSQAGAAVWFESTTLLGGLEPQRVLAIGRSEAAARLSTYVNAIAPMVEIFNGYLVHGRGARGAPVATEPRTSVRAPSPTFIREDLSVPVFIFVTETDLVDETLGYARSRQPDSRMVRTWEVAGTAHGDAYLVGIGHADDGSGVADALLFAAMLSPPRSVYGGTVTCEAPINAGPHPYVVRAALDWLNRWVRKGEAPPESRRLELDEPAGSYLLDEKGIARGGVRTPHVDAPVARLSGLGQRSGSWCRLFGTTVPLGAAAPLGDPATFLQEWSDAVDGAVDEGVVLSDDARRLKEAAAASILRE
jgi:hypothetical protein